MRARWTLAAAALLAAPAAAQTAPGILGKWKTDDGNAIVLIAPCTPGNLALCGWINRFLVPEPAGGIRDGKNPDPKLRGRKVLGSAVLTGLRGSGPAWKGRGYSARDGRNFAATVTIEGDRLKLKGCVAIICRTVVWTRA